MSFAPDSQKINSASFRPRIGILIIPEDPYWIQALEAMRQTNQALGGEIIMLQPAATLQDLYTISQEALVDQILAYELDALITSFVYPSVIEALVHEGLPIICLAELDYQHPLFTAESSLYPSGKIAGEYIGQRLGGRGHAVCMDAGKEDNLITGQSRREGFGDALKAYPAIGLDIVSVYWNYTQAYQSLLISLKDYPHKIDAIFGVSDSIILAARDAGRELGIVDDKTILVGVNGDPLSLSGIAEGSLSATVDIASEDIGARAIKLAHQVARGIPILPVIEQHFQLITRENVASVATQKLAAIANIPSHMVGYNRQQEHDRLSQLEISMAITQQIGSLQERERLFQVIGELVEKYYRYEWMSILRWSEDAHTLVFHGGKPSPVSSRMPLEQDWLLQQAFQANEAIYIPDLRNSHRWHIGKEWEPIRARTLLPIPLGADVIGVLDLQSFQPVRQPSLEIVGLKLLASQLGIVIQNMDLYLEALQAREAAEKANQLKTRLVANVGHEMRSPLNAILGFSQTIQNKLEGGEPLQREELHHDIQMVYKSGEHLMYIINDLLDLSRAEIGALNLYFEPVQLTPFLKDVFAKFVPSFSGSTEVKWALDVPELLPIIRADEMRLRQILINLLSNAGKYTHKGQIALGAAVELPYVHLWVSDTGQGVPAELQQKIFEPFGTTGRKRRPEGIGLGLSITRHLVGLHQGIITLESQLNKGSVFNIYLPLPGVTQETPTPATGSQAIMLVITNRSEAPGEIVQTCQRHGYVHCLIKDWADLNNALSHGSPAAIAWDLAHASLAEWSILARVSASRNCAALPLIIFDSTEKEKKPEHGLTNILFKPCDSNTLKDWVNQISITKEGDGAILIADDDPQIMEYYRELLNSCYPDRHLIFAQNGRQALDILQTETPALILLDLMMPEVDGFTVLENVRNDVRTQNVPVIIISGKLLSYIDIQRINHHKTVLYTKGILDSAETVDFLCQIEGEAGMLPQPTSLLVKQGLAFIHQNYEHSISRKDIAEAVGVSENYLSTIFRQEISISPWDYLARFRIQKAKELLSTTHDSITSIANRIGFNDSAYFSRVFHKLAGQSPVEYRQAKR